MSDHQPPPAGNASALQTLQHQATHLHMQGNLAEAERLYAQALALQPNNYQLLSMLGVLAAQTGRPSLAAGLFSKAISVNPQEPVLHNNLGIALTELQRCLEAEACFDRAISLMPVYSDAYSNRGVALVNGKHFARAFADFDAAISMNPDNAQAYYHKALCCLLLGDYALGLRLYEWRKKTARRIAVAPGKQPLWLGGTSLAGKTLFIYSEQGIGDTIHFSRYALAAAQRAAHVVLGVAPSLRRLIRSLSSSIEVVEQSVGAPNADYQVALMSLPLALSSLSVNIGTNGAYLAADPARIKQWRHRIGDHGLKVGVCWQTGPGNAGRCFPLVALQRLSTIPGVRLVSLQKRLGTAPIERVPPGMEVIDFGSQLDAGPDAFLDTAAIMECLDLVITADTAIAHVAGALARPTWLALQFVPDWRWGLDGSTTFWYPTLRLFRQPQPGHWDSVFDDMHAELSRRG